MLTLWLQEKEILPNASLGYRVPHSDLAPSSQRDYCYMGKNIPNWLMLQKKPLHKENTWNKRRPPSQFSPRTKQLAMSLREASEARVNRTNRAALPS